MIGVLAERLVKKVTTCYDIKLPYGKLSTVIFVLTITGTYYLSSINGVITNKYQASKRQLGAYILHSDSLLF
jgi:hypothetical protein